MKVQEAVASLKKEGKRTKWTVQAGLVNYIHTVCMAKIPNWEIENTADMINHQVAYTKQSLRLAEAMREYKDLFRIQRRKDVINIISNYKDKNIIQLKIQQRILEDNERAKNRTRRKSVTNEEKRGQFFAIRTDF